ncbi:uncharacterized protein LOC123671510 [Harmonia axyridis]|uniref:uncharacterized protein LOC123671510 n=1 Tax=Harmonia axyridis TaxID=115357 RepID=UPI001E274EA2|nr:uncharacterized protein LOC123671510 [Harmonia axyridis]
MPLTCLVVDCRSRSNRDDVKFFSVPAVLSHRFLTHKNELSERRRALWIAAIKKDDLTESKLKNQRVCSKHFITEKPAALEDENHPDWVPSQKMGHKSQKIHRKQADVEKKGKLDKRRKLSVEQADIDVELNSEAPDHGSYFDTGVASQTDITMEELTLKFDQLSFASKTIERLEKKLTYRHLVSETILVMI